MSHSACEDDIKMIEITVLSIENTERSIIKGSDEHLDLILEIGESFSESAELIKKVIEDIEWNFNSYSSEKALKYVFGINKQSY